MQIYMYIIKNFKLNFQNRIKSKFENYLRFYTVQNVIKLHILVIEFKSHLWSIWDVILSQKL